MGLYGFVLSACNGRFDMRHMALFAACFSVFAYSNDNGVKNQQIACNNSATHAAMQLPVQKPERVVVLKTASLAVQPEQPAMIYDKTALTLFDAHKVSEDAPTSKLSDLKIHASLIENSLKTKASCSADAAHAAANGDTSKISPCIADLLSGDEEKIKNMPANMAKLFIETMNDPNASENAPQIMINSMMAMMEAMTSDVKTPKETSSTK